MILPRLSSGLEDQRVMTGALRIADVLIVLVCGFAAYYLRHGFQVIPDPYLVAIGLGGLLAANYLQLAKLYRYANLQHFAAQFGSMTAGWGAVILTLTLIAYFGKVSDSFSRVWAIYWFIAAYSSLVGLRLALVILLRRWRRQGRLTYNVVVVGAGEFGQRLVEFLSGNNAPDVKILGLFDDRKTRIPDAIDDLKVMGTVDDLLIFARTNTVDQIAIALPWTAGDRLTALLQKLNPVAANITLCPGPAAFEIPNMGYDDIAGVPMLTIFKPPLTGWNRIMKGVEDRLLAAVILAIVWPVMLGIALAIRSGSPGPVIYRQRRYGFNSNEITIYKFRSMFWSPNSDDAAMSQAQRNDKRVTPLGRFIRRTSLDELPQLFNVLKGEMSLVGPRPHAVAHNEAYAKVIDEYLVRHKVKPGITGWAQVNGFRGETASYDLMRQRVRLDLDYIDNWSLFFDLKILALTLVSGFVHENAY